MIRHDISFLISSNVIWASIRHGLGYYFISCKFCTLARVPTFNELSESAELIQIRGGQNVTDLVNVHSSPCSRRPNTPYVTCSHSPGARAVVEWAVD